MGGDIWAIWERVKSDTCSESLEDRWELLDCI